MYSGALRPLYRCMGIGVRVLDYSVSTLRNDLVDYRRVIRLNTVLGTAVFLAFPEVPPADWLLFTGPNAVVYLPATDFDDTYRVLREESPVFVTVLDLLGLRAFMLNSGDEAPGQAATDPPALVEVIDRAGHTVAGESPPSAGRMPSAT